jgi:hypothetical protein
MLGRKKIGYFIAIRSPLLLFASHCSLRLRFTVQDDRAGLGLGSGNEGIETSRIGSGF